MARADDFETRRAHLKDLSEEQLYERFWELANKLVDPLLDMGKIYMMITVAIVPIIIVYLLLSKYIIAGITLGGVKE